MHHPTLVLLFALLGICGSGCVTTLQTNLPSEQKLRLHTNSPERYKVRVAAEQPADYPVARDGRVSIHVPNLGLGCGSRLFDVVPVYDKSPAATQAIHLVKDETVVLKLSLKQLDRLPLDKEGFHVIKLDD